MSNVIRAAFGASGGRLRSIEDCRAAAHDLFCRAGSIDEDVARRGEAMTLYREAIALDPQHALAHTNLGNLHYFRGEIRDARSMYTHAIELEPKQPEALYNMAYLIMETSFSPDRYTRAIELFQRAIASRPYFADAHYNLAWAFEQVGDRENALVHWKRNLQLDPDGEYALMARSHL